jgi:hypothetical protein
VSKNVNLVRLDADEAGRQLRDGRVVARRDRAAGVRLNPRA